jgi:hypothetical protein
MRTASRTVIYIVGLSHSGSTVLDMMLTTGGKAVGMGQIWTVLREESARRLTRVCSCGASAPECPVWGPVIARLGEAGAPSEGRDRYELVLQSVARHYGSELAIIDSSKHASHLAILAEIPDLQLKVLHNIKDVRAFTISTLDNAKRKTNKRLLPEKVFLQWYRDNRNSYTEATRALGQPPHRVMYEGLCLATDCVTERLAEVLGENYIDAEAPLNSGHTHIIAGNRLSQRQEVKSKPLAYDYRWLVRSEWLRPYALLPIVRHYNERCLRELTSVAL